VTLEQTLLDVWREVMVVGSPSVEVGGTRHRVGRTRSAGLKVVSFTYEGRTIDGIEQNPETRSRWAQLAREGQRIVQFSTGGRYFANVCDGAIHRYPSWRSLGLPE